MHKLLSLVLSVSILLSSITPALAQAHVGRSVVKGLRRNVTLADRKAFSTQIAAQVNRRVAQSTLISQTLQTRIVSGHIKGIAAEILKKPANLRAPVLRNEFVTLSLIPGALTEAQRAQAVKAYETQLKNTQAILSGITDYASFIKYAQENPTNADVVAVRNLLADASALGLVGTQKDAAALVDFCEQAQGTSFDVVAAKITANGLLRMKAYEELETILIKYGQRGNALDGVKQYIKQHQIPVNFPPLQEVGVSSSGEVVEQDLADFLSKDSFSYNRLHAGFYAKDTEQWVNLNVSDILKNTPSVPQQVPAAHPSLPAADAQAATQTFTAGASASSKHSPKRMINVQKILKRGEDFDRQTFPVEIMDASGLTTSAPISFSIGSSLSVNGYDHVVFHEDPSFENKYIIELHDHGKEPIKMGHFYMALYNSDIGALVKAAQKAGVSLRLKLEHTANVNYETITKPVYDKEGNLLPLEISVQLGKPLWAREMSQAMSHWMESSLGISSTYSQHILAQAKLVLRNNGEIWMQLPGSKELTPLPSEYYVRLPKHQVQNVVALLPHLEKGQTFNIILSPTSNRVNMVARDASLTNVSLGKTMGSVVYHSMGMEEANAKSLMMGINYIMPGLASLMTPALKKYGEKNLLTLSLGMSVAAGMLATLGGFNGFVEGITLGPVQKGLFITSLLLMSGASIIKQLVSNMLIRANRGEVVLSSSHTKTADSAAQAPQTQGMALLQKRFKEFFTKKSEMSLRDLVLYNKSFVYKNVGTLLFLASPFLIEYGTLALTGIDLGIDYSASFPLYTGYSAYVMWKVLRSKLRDAYTAKNLLQSQQMLSNMLKTGAKALAKPNVTKTTIDDVARSFKDSLDALVFAHIKVNPLQGKKEFYQDAKEHILADLENDLKKGHHVPAVQAKQLVAAVEASINAQENNVRNMIKMLKAPGVGALATAMTLATVHEFVISSSFAGTMKDLISAGELANFLMATFLYVPLIIGRLGGNWISRRISPDTMYLLCSGLSATGTVIMSLAGPSVSLSVTGAAIATLGVGNFFSQMYDYIMNKYPKQNREVSSILALTMGVAGIGAVPAGYITTQATGAPLDLWYAGAALVGSLLLTPGMMKNSSFVKAFSQPWNRIKTNVKKWFRRGPDVPPAAQASAN